MKREGSAVRKGGLEDGKGTNPEELVAAAHAGCLSISM
jgi:organic hydroperoxide reductase OsmC/OhrA